MKRVTVETSQGEAEAVSSEKNVWQINTPWTSSYFHGTQAQARAELKRIVHRCENDEIADAA
jgi:hypothetical protein